MNKQLKLTMRRHDMEHLKKKIAELETILDKDALKLFYHANRNNKENYEYAKLTFKAHKKGLAALQRKLRELKGG